MNQFRAWSVATGFLLILAAGFPAFGQEDIPAATEDEIPLRDRNISLTATQMPLKEALEKICLQAGASLEWDYLGLTGSGLKPNQPVDAELVDEPMRTAIPELLNSEQFPGVMYEVEENILRITSLQAWQTRNREHTPEWAASKRGIHTQVNRGGDVVCVRASGEELTDEMMARLATLPKLRELHLSRADKLTDSGIANLAKMTALEELELGNTDKLGDAALSALRGHRSLQTVHISDCGTTDAGVALLQEVPQLRDLRLYQEDLLTDASIASISELTDLRRLDLSNHVGRMRFTGVALARLSSLQKLESLHLTGHKCPLNLLPLPRLQSLTLYGSTVDDRFASLINQSPNLEHLTFSHTSIGDSTLMQISILNKLRSINIQEGHITDKGLKHLQLLGHLERVSISGFPITNQDISCLSQIKTLRQISLGGNVDASGLAQLKDLPRLQTLWLAGMQDVAGFAGLKSLSQLKELHFEMCSINEQQFDALVTALPETEITSATGGWYRSSREKRAQPGAVIISGNSL